jgi:regulator of protease activity HflC (stomatin/prohibitin superfamily)
MGSPNEERTMTDHRPDPQSDASEPEPEPARGGPASRLHRLARAVRAAFSRGSATRVTRPASHAGRALASAASGLPAACTRLRAPLLMCAAAGAAGWLLWTHPPVRTVPRGEAGVRTNRLTGNAVQLRAGTAVVLPGLHELVLYDLRDQVYRPEGGRRADGPAPFQSVEGLSLGVDLTIRYALDPSRVETMARDLPADVGTQVVAPAVQGVVYRVFTRYTVREIFSTRRAEIQQAIESELKPRLSADGIVLRAVQIGQVDLPPDYRRGMENLLAEELAAEKMRYTLELKDKEVKQSELEAEAEKVKREKAAEAAGQEQVIAAKAQEEAMQHVLPFKQKQIEQRKLEAEAEKVARIRGAEGSAEARRIEAAGEADSRQKLADAEAYRLERVGKVTSDQMARDGDLITRHPLLIQKTLADKLSDKIQVIIAPPPAAGGFIGAALVGASANAHPASVAQGGGSGAGDAANASTEDAQ